MEDLNGKVALVTGASRGVGAATAVALARAGCDVACAARATRDAPQRTVGTIDDTVERVVAAGRRGLALPTNLAIDDEVVAMVDRTVEHFGRLDILVNNAAITFVGDLDIPLSRYDLVMAVNLRAPLIAIRRAAPAMAAGGEGSVVNVSSVAAFHPHPGLTAYGISKIGLERLSVDAARILAPQGIAVNCFRIDIPVASEGFVANAPGADRSQWEPSEVAAEGIVWMAAQPASYTGRRESMFALRAREGIMASRVAHPVTTAPPTELFEGLAQASELAFEEPYPDEAGGGAGRGRGRGQSRPRKRTVKIGISLGSLRPSAWTEITVAADRLGYDSVWMPEHLVIPVDATGSPHAGQDHPPIPSNVPVFDVFTYLGFLAGRTERIRFGTQVYNIGLRHPFVVARGVATLDVVSGGRVELGIGASWLQAEWDAVGLDFATRGQRVDEAIDVCRRLWTDDVVDHHGTHFDFPPVMFEPKPVQQPHPPLHIGGDGPAALRRAATVGDGWIPMNHSLEEIPAAARRLAERRQQAGRAGTIEITLGAGDIGPEELAAYAAAGVGRVLVKPWRNTKDAMESLQRFAEHVLPAANALPVANELPAAEVPAANELPVAEVRT